MFVWNWIKYRRLKLNGQSKLVRYFLNYPYYRIMKRGLLFIVFLVLLNACQSVAEDQNSMTNTSTVPNSPDSTLKADSVIHQSIPNYDDSLNYIDENGWKQGKHIDENTAGKVLEEATYVNDTIVGYYRYWDGMQKDGLYKNCKKHGNFNWYYANGTILLITHYENDSAIWHAPYIANQQHIIPIKPISVEVDSAVYVKVHHPNKKLWYEGLFENKEPVGIHNVYYESGDLKGTINYKINTYTSFDSEGNVMEESVEFPYEY